MTEALHAYLVSHGTPPDEIQRELIDETHALGNVAIMQIAPEQGAFMTLLARILGARRAIEIGTFTGYSALCLARGLPDDGKLICCDVSEEWTSVGRRYWERAGVAHKIDLRIAPALETLAGLAREPQFDLAFIDADKSAYIAYFEALLPLMRAGGVILVDNVLWKGAVIDPEADDANTLAIRKFNDFAAADRRVECVMLPIADGLTLLRKP
ncbi:MAG: class I SAM-dependent methyltransferase [Deltaproteobacteria bacterium]|nr:class I SAM-dependent methyltransferase [Deltaproteobacteria bacterium]MBW2541971.1 class I SAM-dependent methyltransferase [Deltaproteobacteria bacterium]